MQGVLSHPHPPAVGRGWQRKQGSSMWSSRSQGITLEGALCTAGEKKTQKWRGGGARRRWGRCTEIDVCGNRKRKSVLEIGSIWRIQRKT